VLIRIAPTKASTKIHISAEAWPEDDVWHLPSKYLYAHKGVVSHWSLAYLSPGVQPGNQPTSHMSRKFHVEFRNPVL